MKHIICTRFLFEKDDYELMDWYIEVSKNTLIPSLQSQTSQNFVWGIVVAERHEEWLKSKINGLYPYIVFNNYEDFRHAGYNTQTRHDIDDIMHEKYVAYIQDFITLSHADTLLLYANLTIMDYFTKKTTPYPVWNDNNTSSFITTYQKNINPDLHVYMCQHTDLWKHVQPVVQLPMGLCYQVKHGKNISGK
jgi:hypothetical protein